MPATPDSTQDSTLSLPSPAPLREGQVIDGFRLEARLHQGGMANLWSVSRVTPVEGESFRLMMKVPRIKGGEDPATIVGFEVEQMLMPALKGPHVPRFVARGDWTRQAYIVMERIEGDSLRPQAWTKRRWPLDEVVEIGIARGPRPCTNCTASTWCTWTSNPATSCSAPTARAVLVDFGLSRHDKLPDLLEEEFSLPMGTGPYMSPEQVQFVRNDPRSDLFALGVMLYHLHHRRTARLVHPTARCGACASRLYVEPLPLRAIDPNLPPWFQEIVLHCLEVKPERRYQSAAQLMLDLQSPQSVALTRRAEKTQGSSSLKTLKRWFFALGAEPAVPARPGEQLDRSPIIMAAIDIESATPALLEQLCEHVRRVVQAESGARLACVSVMKTARLGMDELTDSRGQSLHVKQLIALKSWARPISRALDLQDGRLTFHVLEAPDAATAIVEFASRNGIDHIVMGARGTSALRRYLGSVSSQVLAESDCTVTVVRER